MTVSIGRKIISGMAWTAVATWIGQGINFVAFAVLAFFLDPKALGLGTVAVLPSIILSVLVTNGVPDAVIQRPRIEPIHLDSAFWFLTALGAALSALIWIGAGPFAAAFGQPIIENLVHWTSVIVIVQAVTAVQTAILRRNLDFRFLALRNLVGIVAAAALAMTMAVEGWGVWSLIALQVARPAVASALLFFVGGWQPRLCYSHARCKELLTFAWPIVGQNVLALGNDELPTVALGIFLGPAAVGIYAFSRRPFAILWDCFLNPLVTMVMPTVSRFRDDRAKIDSFFNTAVRMAAILGCSIFVGFAAIAPVAVPAIFGVQWEAAVPSIQIITPLAVLRTLAAICANTVVACGYPRLVLKLNIAFMALSAIPVIIAARVSIEVMWTTIVVCNLLFVPALLYFAQEIAGVSLRQPLAIFPRLAVVAALMFGAVTAAQHGIAGVTSQHILIVLEVLLGIMVYAAMAMMLLRPDILAVRTMLLRLRHEAAV